MIKWEDNILFSFGHIDNKYDFFLIESQIEYDTNLTLFTKIFGGGRKEKIKKIIN